MRSTLTSPSAIMARLQIASEEGWALELRVSDGTEVSGIVALADDCQTLQVLNGQALTSLRPGAPAHARITGPTGDLSFYSGVVRIGAGGQIDLELPRVLRVVDNRGLSRQSLGADANVQVVVPLGADNGVFEVVDLSSHGLSFRVPAQLYELARDQRLHVRLAIPGARSLHMTVSVRNLRRDPQARGSRLIGARVVDGPEDLAAHVIEALKKPGHAA